jgi:hypothetical protein
MTLAHLGRQMSRTAKPKTQRKDLLIGVQVETGMKQRLEEIARDRDVPLSQLVREALKQYLEKAA